MRKKLIIFNNHAFLLIQRNVLLQENRHKMHRKWKGKEPPSSRVKADVTSFWNIITNRVTFLTTSLCFQMLATRLRIRWNKSCQGWYLCQLTSSLLACWRHGWWQWPGGHPTSLCRAAHPGIVCGLISDCWQGHMITVHIDPIYNWVRVRLLHHSCTSTHL